MASTQNALICKPQLVTGLVNGKYGIQKPTCVSQKLRGL